MADQPTQFGSEEEAVVVRVHFVRLVGPRDMVEVACVGGYFVLFGQGNLSLVVLASLFLAILPENFMSII